MVRQGNPNTMGDDGIYDDVENDRGLPEGELPVPDDVPVDDAVEQRQAVDPQQSEAALAPDADISGLTPPLESDPGDWQEQHQSLDDDDADDERR